MNGGNGRVHTLPVGQNPDRQAMRDTMLGYARDAMSHFTPDQRQAFRDVWTQARSHANEIRSYLQQQGRTQ